MNFFTESKQMVSYPILTKSNKLSSMTILETVTVFEKIWNIDIINISEPSYSICIAIIYEWNSYNSLFHENLLKSLDTHWFDILKSQIELEYKLQKHQSPNLLPNYFYLDWMSKNSHKYVTNPRFNRITDILYNYFDHMSK